MASLRTCSRLTKQKIQQSGEIHAEPAGMDEDLPFPTPKGHEFPGRPSTETTHSSIVEFGNNLGNVELQNLEGGQAGADDEIINQRSFDFRKNWNTDNANLCCCEEGETDPNSDLGREGGRG